MKISSNAAFSIRPIITVLKPVLDSNVVVGGDHTDAVEWSLGGSTKVSEVDIIYSTNDAFPCVSLIRMQSLEGPHLSRPGGCH